MCANRLQLQEILARDTTQEFMFSNGYSGVLCTASEDRVVADVLLHIVVVGRHAALEQLAEGLASLGVLSLLRGHVAMGTELFVSPSTYS